MTWTLNAGLLLALAAAALGAGFALGLRWNQHETDVVRLELADAKAGFAAEQRERAEEYSRALQQVRANEQNWREQARIAEERHVESSKRNEADAAAAAAALGGLRKQLSAARARVARDSAPAGDAVAASALGIAAECAGEYRAVAVELAACAAELDRVMGAWPR
jgi:cell division septum initiation protein DivIVA